MAPADIEALRPHTQQQRAWSSDRFREQIEALTQRAASVRPEVDLGLATTRIPETVKASILLAL